MPLNPYFQTILGLPMRGSRAAGVIGFNLFVMLVASIGSSWELVGHACAWPNIKVL